MLIEINTNKNLKMLKNVNCLFWKYTKMLIFMVDMKVYKFKGSQKNPIGSF